jgi:anti-sigma regulatory factor (Ser/Thr protein kinase)
MDLTLELTLAPDMNAPSAARSAITNRFSGSLATRALDDARLLVTELISNSLRHAALRKGDHVSVRALETDGLVRFEVADPGRNGPPLLREPGAQEGGYGLLLVRRLSRRWGIHRDGETVVWFELAVRSGR